MTNALNVSCLAKVTDGFTQGHIVQVVKGVLTERRVRQQPHRPLVAHEFIPALSSLSPVYQEEEETFKVSGRPRGGSERRHPRAPGAPPRAPKSRNSKAFDHGARDFQILGKPWSVTL